MRTGGRSLYSAASRGATAPGPPFASEARSMKHPRLLSLSTLLVFLGASVGCECGAPPPKAGLKAEGVPCGADDECETGLCDAIPKGEALCVRKCTVGCRE